MEKNTKRKPPVSSAKKTKAKNKNTAINFEIVSICIIALSIYLLICIFSGGSSGGFVGRLINNAVTGLIGTCAYILPLMTIALFVYAVFFAQGDKIKSKFILSYSMLFNLAGIFQMISAKNVSAKDWFIYGLEGNLSGGFFGGIIITVLRCLGDAGAYIILFSAFLVLFVLTFDISITKLIQGTHSKVTSAAKEVKSHVKEEKASKRGVALVPEYDNIEKYHKDNSDDIVFNLPEETQGEYSDPEIKVYDDVTSGPEDQEPSEEEKEAKRLSGEETENITREIQEEIDTAGEQGKKIIEYNFPDIELLTRAQPNTANANVQEELMQNARQLVETLHSFKVDAKVVEISQGPTITRYEIEPAEGIRVNQITNLSKDIGLRFKADKGVMVAPVPGKSTIGIEIENKNPSVVSLREVIESDEFKNHKSKLSVALGKDVSGKPVIMDLAKMPHLLIAGAQAQVSLYV